MSIQGTRFLPSGKGIMPDRYRVERDIIDQAREKRYILLDNRDPICRPKLVTQNVPYVPDRPNAGFVDHDHHYHIHKLAYMVFR